MKLIIASKSDPAAANIAQKLIELGGFKKTMRGYERPGAILLLIETESTELASPPIDASEIVVLSRHASESGRPSLTTHVPGLLDQRRIAIASPQTIRAALLELQRANDDLRLGYQVSLEATHHGPADFSLPVTFIEVGSTPAEWKDERAGEAAARAALAALSPERCSGAVGVGGIHYAPLFTRVSLETDIGIGHIIPKYASLSDELLQLAIERTAGGVQYIVVDWKGASAEQREICNRVGERLGIPVVKAGTLLKKDLNQTRDNSERR